MLSLKTLTLTGFKSHKEALFQFADKMNCFVGLNGVGKTNILEAIYYLCMTKAQSGLMDKQLVNHEMDFFRVEGAFVKAGKKLKVVAKYPVAGKKVMEENGLPTPRLSDHIGKIPVVMIAPDDVQLVTESGEMRRKFMDTTLSQVSAEYLQALIGYNHTMKQRNALLKQAQETGRLDYALLDAYDQQLLAPAQIIYHQRKAFFEAFVPIFLEKYALIASEREVVEVVYQSVLSTQPFAEILTQNREKDRILARTTQGVHRDDLLMTMGEQAIRSFGSQGQLKSYLLALRLAQYAYLREVKQEKPILLLDDIFDKLDMQRVSALVRILSSDEYGQIFITDTQKERIEAVVSGIEPEKVALFTIGV